MGQEMRTLCALALLCGALASCPTDTVTLDVTVGATTSAESRVYETLAEALAARESDYLDKTVIINVNPGKHIVAQPGLVLGGNSACTTLLGTSTNETSDSIVWMDQLAGHGKGKPVLHLQDTHDITIDHLAITMKWHAHPSVGFDRSYGKPHWHDKQISAVEVRDSKSIVVKRNFISGGLRLGGEDNIIEGNSVTNPDGFFSCVSIMNCGDARTLKACNITVLENEVYDCYGSLPPYDDGSAGIVLHCTVGVVIRNNHVYNTGSWGIRLNNNDLCPTVKNQVFLNHIEKWGIRYGYNPRHRWDAAAFYFYGHWYSPGNHIYWNYIHQPTKGFGMNCFYLDDAVSFQNISNNICQDAMTGAKVNGGLYNLFQANIYLNVNGGYVTCRGLGWTSKDTPKSWYTCNRVWHQWGGILRKADYLGPAWSKEWPEYRNFCNPEVKTMFGVPCDPDHMGYDCWALPHHNVQASNLIVGKLGPAHFRTFGCKPKGMCPTFVCDAKNPFNFDLDGASYPKDPGFVDLAGTENGGGDLTLKPDSPVWTDKRLPGFTQIPFKRIGPKGGLGVTGTSYGVPIPDKFPVSDEELRVLFRPLEGGLPGEIVV